MNFSDGDELFLDTVRRFAAEQIRPHLRDTETKRDPAADMRAQFRALGFEAIDLPESIGGSGLGLGARLQLNRLLAEADAGAALALDRIGPASFVVEAFGGENALTQWVAPVLASPNQRIALVVDPNAGKSDTVEGIIPWAPIANADLVVGLGPDGAFVLSDGINIEPVRGFALHGGGASRIAYKGKAAASWRNARASAAAWDKIRLYYAALIWGVLSDSAAFSRAYALDRVAFGKPIAHHQGLAFLIVDMFTAVERAGLLISDAASQIESGAARPGAGALAFVDAIEAAAFVGPNGVQILGGHGFMRDFPMEKAMRDCRALGLLGGGLDAAREAAGLSLAPTSVSVEKELVS